jgi:hypothetical protein
MDFTFSPADLKKQVELLVIEARKGDPQIQKIYWFESPTEVRLVEVTENVIPSEDSKVEAFYFPPDKTYGMPALSGIALVHPSEEFRSALPEGWGSWSDAKVVLQ